MVNSTSPGWIKRSGGTTRPWLMGPTNLGKPAGTPIYISHLRWVLMEYSFLFFKIWLCCFLSCFFSNYRSSFLAATLESPMMGSTFHMWCSAHGALEGLAVLASVCLVLDSTDTGCTGGWRCSWRSRPWSTSFHIKIAVKCRFIAHNIVS
jgi:hypothetical protein